MQRGDLLAQIPLFMGLSDADRETLASALVERRYPSGAIVFEQGETGASMFLVVTGIAQIYLPAEKPAEAGGGPEVILKEAHTGEYFGELALFDDKPRSASVRVLEETVLLELTRDELSAHLSRSKTAAMAILREMSERLRETNALLSQRAARDVAKEFEEGLSWSERLADKVAMLNGSWAFILFLVGLTAAWALVNGTIASPFDAYPYQFYNLALAILVALQGPLIVMSQNRQSRQERAQADADFRVNLKNEVGIERILGELSALRAELGKRLDVMDRAMQKDRIQREMPTKQPLGSTRPARNVER
jgi:uncharacterized membrane protein